MVTQRSWVWAQLSAVIVPVFKEVIQQNHSEIAGTWPALCLAQESSLSMAAIVRPPVLRHLEFMKKDSVVGNFSLSNHFIL